MVYGELRCTIKKIAKSLFVREVLSHSREYDSMVVLSN